MSGPLRVFFRADEGAGVEMGGSFYYVCHDDARKPLPVADDDVQGPGRQVVEKHDSLIDVAEFVKHHLHEHLCRFPAGLGHDAVDHCQMAFHYPCIGIEIRYVVGHGELGRGYQQVGDAAEGGDHHHLASRSFLHYLFHVSKALDGADRGASKLHYFHRCCHKNKMTPP